MTRLRAARRAWTGAAVLVQLLAFVRGAQAQVRDTTVADTLRADTLAAVQDSAAPPPLLVELPVGKVATGLASGTWVWDREALLDEAAVSVTDLLARIPGIATFRSGVYLQPEAASVFGGGPSRLRVELNGFVLDPLATASLDLSTVELAALSEVRIERRADFLLIRLRTEAPRDARPYSRIEAGVGQPRANVFRGLLLAPRFLIGPIGLAVERVEVQGSARPQPADAFAGWVRWGLLSEARGIEFELRTDRINREPESPRPEELRRQDVVIRARNRFGAGLTAEVYFGRSSLKLDGLDAALPDSLRPHIDRSSDQVGVRAAFERGPALLEGAVRWRNGAGLPSWQTDLAASFGTDRLLVRADLDLEQWSGGPSASSVHAFAAAPITAGISAFGEFASGTSGAPPLRLDSIGSPHVFDRSVYRGGIEFERWGISTTGALVRVSTDSVAAFGLPGDTVASSTVGGSVTGWEATARIPVLGNWLAASGSWTTWFSGSRWTYLPASSGMASLLLNSSPLESDNLEFTGRFEFNRRGSMLAPPTMTGAAATQQPARMILNAYIEIRIIDVRIFGRFDDLAGQDVQDLPGLLVRGPRILYGVKWSFWN